MKEKKILQEAGSVQQRVGDSGAGVLLARPVQC